MFVIGITGGIGCGKSTASAIMSAHGIEVLDADKISHEVTQAGGAAVPEIIEHFGPQFISEDGSLDRRKMADEVFSDRRELDALSLIVHRHVMSEMTRRREKLAAKKCKACVMDVPVPVREGFLDSCDQIWVIWADEEVRLERLEGRGMDPKDAKQRMQIQMSEEEYKSLAQEFILNNGSVRELEAKLNRLMEREFLGRGILVKTDFVYSESLEAAAEAEAEAEAPGAAEAAETVEAARSRDEKGSRESADEKS